MAKNKRSTDRKSATALLNFVSGSDQRPSRNSVRDMSRGTDLSTASSSMLADAVRLKSDITSKKAEVVSSPIVSKQIDETVRLVRQIKIDTGMMNFNINTILDNSVKTFDKVKGIGENISSIETKVDEQTNMIRKIFKDLSEGGAGPGIGDIDLSLDKGKKPKSAPKPGAKPAAGMLSSAKGLAKGLIKKAPIIGGAVAAGFEYAESGDLGRAVVTGIGAGLGSVLGGIVGAVGGPVGVLAGGVGGGMLGESLAKSGYDMLFGKKNVESAAVTKTRQETAGGTTYTPPLGTTAVAPTKHSTSESTPSYIAPGDVKSFGSLTELIKGYEGFSAKAFWDHRQYTNGYGTRALSPTEEITKEEAEKRLNLKIAEFKSIVDNFSTQYKYNWNDNQKNALTSFVYNLGPGALSEVTANGTRKNEEIAVKMLEYNKASGRTEGGLVNRRRSEAEMFNRGVGADLKGAAQTAPGGAPAAGGYQYPGQKPAAGSIQDTGGSLETEKPAPNVGMREKPTPDATPSEAPPSGAPGTEGGDRGGANNLTFAPGVDSDINKGIAAKISQIQSSFGPLSITSGYRDPKRNAAVGGANNSAHMRANAVDVSFSGDADKTLKLVEVASKAGIGGIGVYRPGLVHLDTESRRVWGPDYTARSVPSWAKEALSAHLSGQWGQYDSGAAGRGPTRVEGAPPGSMAQGAPQGMMIPQGMSRAQYGPQGMFSPDLTSRAQVPGPMGMATGMPGLGPFAGILSALGAGGPRGLTGSVNNVGSLLGGIMGMLGGRQSQANRAYNPTFAPDRYENNRVPSALPSSVLLRELFDLNVSPGYNPVGYAFGR